MRNLLNNERNEKEFLKEGYEKFQNSLEKKQKENFELNKKLQDITIQGYYTQMVLESGDKKVAEYEKRILELRKALEDVEKELEITKKEKERDEKLEENFYYANPEQRVKL